MNTEKLLRLYVLEDGEVRIVEFTGENTIHNAIKYAGKCRRKKACYMAYFRSAGTDKMKLMKTLNYNMDDVKDAIAKGLLNLTKTEVYET